MSYLIPLSPDPYYEQITALDGTDFRLSFRWNNRDLAWYLSIADLDDQPIASGIRLVPDALILRKVRDARRPPGELVLIDETGEGAAPGFDDMGRRHSLVYFTAEECGRGSI